MAQKVHVELVDDLDGSEATETVNFGLDGTPYEIDLSSGNAAEMRDGLAQFVQHARNLGRVTTAVAAVSRRQATQDVGASTTEIRAWLVNNGYAEDMKVRGRIPGHLRALFASRTPKLTESAPMPARAEVEEGRCCQESPHDPEVADPPVTVANTVPALTLLPAVESDPAPTSGGKTLDERRAARSKRARMPRTEEVTDEKKSTEG